MFTNCLYSEYVPPSSVVALSGGAGGPAATALNARTRTSYRVNFFKADTLNSVADHPFTVSVLHDGHPNINFVYYYISRIRERRN